MLLIQIFSYSQKKKFKNLEFYSVLHSGTVYYTWCLKISEFRIQSVVGDHFSSPNMEIKKNRDSPHKDTLV
jgi:hypothetical protein